MLACWWGRGNSGLGEVVLNWLKSRVWFRTSSSLATKKNAGLIAQADVFEFNFAFAIERLLSLLFLLLASVFNYLRLDIGRYLAVTANFH